MNGDQVSQRQLIILISFYAFGTIVYTMPRNLAGMANHSGWISILLAMGLFLVYSLLIVKVGKNLEKTGLDMIAYCHHLFGPYLGKVFTFFVVLLPLTLFAAITIRIATELYATLVLPETPIELMIAMLLFIRIAMVSGGVGVIARWTEIIMPFVTGMICILVILSFSNFEWHHATPLFDATLIGIAKGNQPVIGAMAEGAVLLFFWFSIKNRERTLRSLFIVNLTVGLLFFIIFIVTLGVYGLSSTKAMTYPFIEVIRDVSLGELIEHLESFSFVVWMLIMLSKGSLTFFACCEGWRCWFGMNDHRPIMIPITFIVFFLSLLPQNVTESIIEFETVKGQVFPFYAFIVLSTLIAFDFLRKRTIT